MRLEAQALLSLEVPCANVRGHDDDRALEVHLIAKTIRELTNFNTCNRMLNIRTSLLDFIEQDQRIRRSLHPFGQLSTFLVPT